MTHEEMVRRALEERDNAEKTYPGASLDMERAYFAHCLWIEEEGKRAEKAFLAKFCEKEAQRSPEDFGEPQDPELRRFYAEGDARRAGAAVVWRLQQEGRVKCPSWLAYLPAQKTEKELAQEARSRMEEKVAADLKAGKRPCLSGLDLRGADLSKVELQSAYFVSAKLERACFDGARIVFTAFNHAYLSGASFRSADLRGSDFVSTDLSGANLRGAKLRGANLRGANLYCADLTDADLYGANLSGANLTKRGKK